jgi:MFS transporter, DHA1 family, multidrug resistance protein
MTLQVFRTITPSAISPAQRRRGIHALMISNFFAWAGFFMVIPLVAIHYVDHLGWAAGTVGIILALRQFGQQGLTTLFGVVCDRIGPKPLICAGMLVRAVGFAAMAYAETFATVLIAALLAALGGAMFESPKSASMATLSTPETRQRLFSTLGVIGGIGTTLGTQLGAHLIRADFALVCLAGAAAYIIIFVVVLFLMPSIGVSIGPVGSSAGLRKAFGDRTFMAFLIILTGYWFAWTQFGLTISLAATDIAGTDSAVSWIYAVNAVVTVGLGYVLPRWLERWLTSLHLLIAGTAVIGFGLLAVGFAAGTPGVLVAAAIFSLGAVLARPGQETVTANLADPAARGTYFGVAALSLAVGGGFGNYLGGLIYDLGGNGGNQMLWMVYAAIALASALGLWFLRQQFSIVRGETPLAPDLPPTQAHPAGLKPSSRRLGQVR